jgi:hypothetical protein
MLVQFMFSCHPTDHRQGIINALDHIRCFWHDLMDGSVNDMRRINEVDVRSLELLAPGASRADLETIARQIRGGHIFSSIDETRRDGILGRLRSSSGLIPTLHSFFRDLNYWEVCLSSLRHLFLPSRRESMISAMQNRFTGINQRDGFVMIQNSASTFVVATGTEADQVEYGYRQLVLFTMRHFIDLPRVPTHERVLCKPRAKTDEALLYHFAGLAQRLGFESPEIDSILALPSENPPLSDAATEPVTVTSGPGEQLQHRCGLPKLRSFQEDQPSLFLDQLERRYHDNEEGITSFFVRQSVYIQFLGRTNGTVVLPERGERSIPSDQAHAQSAEDGENLNAGGGVSRGLGEAESRNEYEDEDSAWSPVLCEDVDVDDDTEALVQQEPHPMNQPQVHFNQRYRTEWVADRSQDMVILHFKLVENGIWRDVQTLYVDPMDPSEVARVAKKNMRKGLRTMDTNMQLLAPDDCFEAVTVDGTNTVLLIPQVDLDIDDRLLASANVLGYTAIGDDEHRKRTRTTAGYPNNASDQ